MMLQHGCSWAGDHHTSVKQTTVREKNNIGDIRASSLRAENSCRKPQFI